MEIEAALGAVLPLGESNAVTPSLAALLSALPFVHAFRELDEESA